MKCPLRIGRKPYDGGEWCDPECAWRITNKLMEDACAIAVLAHDKDEGNYVMNYEKRKVD